MDRLLLWLTIATIAIILLSLAALYPVRATLRGRPYQGKATVVITRQPTTEWPFPLPPRSMWQMYLPLAAKRTTQ